MNSKIEKIDFLEALTKLPLIRMYLIAVAQEIIEKTSNSHQENMMMNEKIQSILAEMKHENLIIDNDDEVLIKFGLEMILKAQLPPSKMALKILSMKNNPPKIFQQ